MAIKNWNEMTPPELIEEFKNQLLIVFLKRLGGNITLPISEVDDTSQDLLCIEVNREKKTMRFFHEKKD